MPPTLQPSVFYACKNAYQGCVYGPHDALLLVVANHRNGLLVVGDQTGSEGLRVVIGASDKIFTGKLSRERCIRVAPRH